MSRTANEAKTALTDYPPAPVPERPTRKATVTTHPSAILRFETPDERAEAMEAFVADCEEWRSG